MVSQAPSGELQRAARLREGMRRLGYMEGIDSIGESLDWEAGQVKKQADMDFANINGTDPASQGSAQGSEADMQKQLIAGDVINNNNYYSSGPAEKTTATEPAAPVAATTKRKVTNEQLQAYIKRKVAEGLAAGQSKPAATAAVAAVQPEQSWLRRYWPMIVGGAVGLGGAGAALMPKTPAVDTDRASRYSFEISADAGKGLSTE